MTTATIDRDQIRRDMGLFTVPEVTAVCNVNELDLLRAVTITKKMAFHAGQDGQLLISKADMTALLAGKQLSQGPKIYADADWFSKDESLPHYKLAKMIEADPKAYARPDSKFGTAGISCLVAEARSYAFGHLRSSNPNDLLSPGLPIRKFYAQGPDKFAVMLKGCRERLTSLSLKFGGEAVSLATFSCGHTSQRIANVTKRIGSFSVESMKESGISAIKSTRQFSSDIETALKKAF